MRQQAQRHRLVSWIYPAVFTTSSKTVYLCILFYLWQVWLLSCIYSFMIMDANLIMVTYEVWKEFSYRQKRLDFSRINTSLDDEDALC